MPYVAPKPQGVQNAKLQFSVKAHISRRKSATKFPCVKTISDNINVRPCGLSLRAKIVGGGRPVPFYLKFWLKLTQSLPKNVEFQSIFSLSASAVTPIAKKVQLISIGSLLGLRAFRISLWRMAYVATKRPKGG